MGLFYGLTNPACALSQGSTPPVLTHDYIWSAVSYDNPANGMLLSTDGISWDLYNGGYTDGWNYPYCSFNTSTKEIIKLNFGSGTNGRSIAYALVNRITTTTTMGSNKFGSSSGNPQNLQSTSYWTHWVNGRDTWLSTYPGYNLTYSRKVYRNNGVYFDQATGNNYNKLSENASNFPYIVVDAPNGDLIFYSPYYSGSTGYFYTLPVATYISGTYINKWSGTSGYFVPACENAGITLGSGYIGGCCYMDSIDKFVTIIPEGVVLASPNTDFVAYKVNLGYNGNYCDFGNMQYEPEREILYAAIPSTDSYVHVWYTENGSVWSALGSPTSSQLLSNSSRITIGASYDMVVVSNGTDYIIYDNNTGSWGTKNSGMVFNSNNGFVTTDNVIQCFPYSKS